VFKSIRRLPFLKVLAIAQVALLARRHFGRLSPRERRRLTELVRRGTHLSAQERTELRDLVGRMEPRAFAVGAADRFSPVPIPRRFAGRPR
jgi:hypothetical protein